ncbi:MAG: carboxypeptidase-like regulatory domain-containing protein [Bacteroidia bacterium]|nr:carboxypeptidase-like regulatory domain-containing protein [Bacteroidia bacterium]
MLKNLVLTILFSIVSSFLFAQTIVTGKITEKGKNEAMPFVSIAFKGTTIGTTSNFEGYFSLKTSANVDTLVISFMGYKTITRKIEQGKSQHLTIEMQEEARMIKEVVIRPRLNPALRIVNNAVKNRKINDYALLSSYEYNSYNKTDVSMNNISEKMKNNKLLAPLKQLFDTTNQMKNEDGKYILPILVSETQSRFYYNANPSKTKEIIEASQTNGFGIDQGSYVLDLLGSSILQFNFNQNWMRILGKDFISPLASNSHGYYFYTLRDSTEIDGIKCYEIKLELRRSSDLGFLGTMWIADSTFALKRIVAEISPNANLNFIERLKIQQEQEQTTAGQWIPTKTRAIVELGRITENTSGFIAKLYRANSNIVVNKTMPDAFFDVLVDRQENSTEKDSNYWNNIRPEAYSSIESHMVTMIDSVKRLPVVKTYTEVIRLITEGHYRLPKIDIGPYIFLLNFNHVEGFRTRIGFRTNQSFSKNWYYRGYLAYGFRDEKIKHGAGIERILSNKNWTTIGVHYKNDYDILGVTDPSSAPIFNFGAGNNALFSALNMGSRHSRINLTIDYRLVFLTQLHRDIAARLSFQNTYFEPTRTFRFAYIEDKDKPATPDNINRSFTYTAATLDLRYAYKEVLVSKGINRIRIKLAKAPVVTLSYTHGFKDIGNSDFTFDKIQVNFNQHISTGVFGNADYSLTAGRVFGRLPYPMLEVIRGNMSIIGADNNFNLMNLYEFVADEYIHFWYTQHLEGLIFNRIPIIKKWKWRNYVTAKAAYGNLSKTNKDVIPPDGSMPFNVLPIREFQQNKPYVEVGYGIENIFRLITVGAVHRLTYLSSNKIRKWGINVGLVFKF